MQASPGILLLTNYRLMFISKQRLNAGDSFRENHNLSDSDLSTQVSQSGI